MLRGCAWQSGAHQTQSALPLPGRTPCALRLRGFSVKLALAGLSKSGEPPLQLAETGAQLQAHKGQTWRTLWATPVQGCGWSVSASQTADSPAHRGRTWRLPQGTALVKLGLARLAPPGGRGWRRLSLKRAMPAGGAPGDRLGRLQRQAVELCAAEVCGHAQGARPGGLGRGLARPGKLPGQLQPGPLRAHLGLPHRHHAPGAQVGPPGQRVVHCPLPPPQTSLPAAARAEMLPWRLQPAAHWWWSAWALCARRSAGLPARRAPTASRCA